jgi:hypothetical protein
LQQLFQRDSLTRFRKKYFGGLPAARARMSVNFPKNFKSVKMPVSCDKEKQTSYDALLLKGQQREMVF